MKYKQEYSGQWVQPRRKYYYMQCCDCGLVHKMEFRLIKDSLKRAIIQFRAWRVNKRKG
jgi:Zn-finger protein